jgi:hypothetical protein
MGLFDGKDSGGTMCTGAEDVPPTLYNRSPNTRLIYNEPQVN